MELPSPSSTTTATTVDAFGSSSSSSSSSGSSDAMLDINSVDMPFDAWLTPFNNKPEEELLPSPPESASQGDENELGFGYLPWVLPPQLPPFSPPPAIIARGGCDDHREIGVPSEHESPKTIDGTPATVEDNEIVEVKAKTDTSSFTLSEDRNDKQPQERDCGLSTRKKDTVKENSGRSNTNTNNDSADATALLLKRKKAAHNAIEKRYRTNMNAKFMALGNAIPRPGHNAPHNNHPHYYLTTARRSSLHHHREQNKSEILTNALAYIHDLEDQNRQLQGELALLKERLWVTTTTMTTPATGMGLWR